MISHEDPCGLEKAWVGFASGDWCGRIDVRDFIQRNYMPYDGDGDFLASPTERTSRLWGKVDVLMHQEALRGILDADTDVVSTITSHEPGYVDRDLEVIVGLQTDKPLKRAILPLGGIRMVESALQAYGCELSPQIKRSFGVRGYRKTHNDGVFDVYPPNVRAGPAMSQP